MSYTVGSKQTARGYTFADVRNPGGHHVGRLVMAEPSGTWGPDEPLAKELGQGGRWDSYEAAKAAVEAT